VEREKQLKKELADYEQKIENLRNSLKSDSSKKDIFKKKLREMISLVRVWQNYTTVLGMSATQIFYRIEEIKNQKKKKHGESKVLGKYSDNQRSTFINLEEEDTDDTDISFNEFVEEVRKEESNAELSQGLGKISI